MAALFSAVSFADSGVTLLPTNGIGVTENYTNVNNDAGLDIDILVQLNSSGQTIINVTLEGADRFAGPYFGSGQPFVVTDADGQQIFGTITEAVARKCVKSGRGQSCHNVYVLTGGTLTEP